MKVSFAGWGRGPDASSLDVLVEIARAADRLGYDTMWLAEYGARTPPHLYPNPIPLAAALFQATNRLRIGLSVIVLPAHHPVILAADLAQIDRQSNGRLTVGFGRAAESPVFDVLDYDRATLHDRFDAALDVLIASWTQPLVSGDGRFWHFNDTPAPAHPVQKPHPPIVLAGYTPDSIKKSLDYGYPLLLSLDPPEGRQLRVMEDIGGASPKTHPCSVARFVCVSDTLDSAWEQVQDLYRRRRDLGRHEDFDLFVDERVLWGTPQQCVDQARALQDVGYVELRCVFNGNGIVPDDIALERLILFGEAVIPRLVD